MRKSVYEWGRIAQTIESAGVELYADGEEYGDRATKLGDKIWEVVGDLFNTKLHSNWTKQIEIEIDADEQSILDEDWLSLLEISINDKYQLYSLYEK